MMVKRTIVLCSMVLSLLGSSVSDVSAQEAEDADKTLAPYFFVKSDDPSVDALPLKSTSAQVDIAGVIADVKVKQVYKNEGQKPLEAIYIFPGSTRAAVYGMKMTIGERTIVARIEKREEARQQYEQAKQEGKSASLLEQQRPNVFQMNVANIMPGDEIVVELSYTELLVPTDGEYEFVYPTVVGPRYSDQPEATASASEKWVKNPYLHEGEAPPYTFDIAVDLSTGLPIQQAASPSHKVNINYDGKSFATVKLDDSEESGGNRDFILKYQLAGGQIESGLLLYEGKEENFFLMMVQPPKRIKPADIPPREYIFIVDVSGSMNGFPLDISKKLLKDLIGKLKPDEKFNVLLFASSSAVLSKKGSLPATQKNIKKAIRFLDKQRGGGGTQILPALKRALALPRAKGMSRSLVIATDGYVTVEAQTFDLIRNKLGDANMFSFGIGRSVNRFIIEGMARMGMGEPFVITSPEDAPAQAEKFRQYIQSPVLTDVDLDIRGFDAYAIEPPSIPDVLAERPVIVFGKWRGKAKGTLTLNGFTGGRRYTQSFDVSQVASREENSALRYLWARHRIQILGDYNLLRPDDERVEVITDLGLQYNLLTQYTSFVAIDSEVRNKEGDAATVNQPLPLPDGVSDYAVGQSSKNLRKLAAPKAEFRSFTRGRASEPESTIQGPASGGRLIASGEEKADGDVAPAREPLPSPEPTITGKDEAGAKRVGAKTFQLKDGVWIDTEHSQAKKVIKIKPGSQAYKDLLSAMPRLKPYFKLGTHVIVNIGDYSIEIADDGQAELTEEKLKQLIEAFKRS